MGGLSGKPLTSRSTEVIRFLSERVRKRFRLLVGRIHSADDAIENSKQVLCLLQLYTGFIYEGPAFNYKPKDSKPHVKVIGLHYYQNA
jgi:dihydroorotate dehydrogenase